MEPGLDKRQVIVYIIEKSLCVCCKGIGKHHFFETSDRKDEDTKRYIVKIQTMVFLIFKLRNDFCVVDDRSDNQLWEKGNKQQIIDDIIVLCLSTERVDQKGDQLEREERNTDRKNDMLQRNVGSCDKVYILDKEIGVFVVTKQTDVCKNTGSK